MKYDAVIFDVSDTLIEYSPNYAQIYGDRLRGLGYQISDKKAKEISKEVNWAIGRQTHKEQCGSPSISEEELIKLLDETALLCITNNKDSIKSHMKTLNKVEIPKQEMKIITGVFDVLNILKCNYRLGIVSNHYTWLMEYLKESGLAAYFESIIISEVVGVAKPNIRIMQIILDELQLEANKCLYVGDQPLDVLCSKQIGMDCVWINPDNVNLPISIPFNEDYRIDELSELLNIL
ncbi:HAD-IA family hydrolase [Anaerocolumna sedimenticola]|uniref:HAD-IA family hydrolase n=1 Tax=Anaerocolumna sedimenticola TaxID=2696063 RepID=A0A6P1TPH3_9FIRM|nr:HAD family hydrolase [Anaerocolumna sedimenticola]QHQ63160.1 HAD-IA family hydrolase [Anaerocolumna sedimenticola]